ncbi:hypothetical protein VNO77_03960 [Canavalia gladiata]|uniref:Uncharacterized protein n=1 Tax=Canavalia gladiata TaxID=3824 RepID=A0AAN9MXQ5_CANGL
MLNRSPSIKTLTMQSLSVVSSPHSILSVDNLAVVAAKFNPDFNDKIQTHNDKEENVDEQEFSFACADPQGTLIFADEIFNNGKIQPTNHPSNHSLILTVAHENDTFPIQPSLKKHFTEHVNSFSSGLKGRYNDNEITQKTTMVEVKVWNDKCKKRNSTGFSKIWRFLKGLRNRSYKEGSDSIVFLNPLVPMSTRFNKAKKKNILRKGKGEGCKTTLSAHEKLYVMNRRRRDSIKRKSFLPYKQQLIGFFTNM